MRFRFRRAAAPVVTFASAMLWAFVCGAATPNERYVSQVYADLLGRTPSAGELSGFVVPLDNLTLSRAAFVSAMVGLPEFCDDKTISFYSLLLHRSSTPAERTGFDSLLQGGATFEQVEGIFAGSAEYFTNRGGSTNDGFLDAAFSDFLGRAILPGERSAYDSALTGGTTRQQVADSILGSAEYRGDMVGRNFSTFLRRTPSPAETSGFVGSGLDDRSVVKSILASNEYYSLAQSIPEPAAASAGAVLLLSACVRRRRRPIHRGA